MLINSHAYLNMFCVLFLILLGSFVYFQNRNRTNFAFFLLTSSAAIWQLGTSLTLISDNPDTAFFWTKFSYIGVSLIPVTMFHFVINITQKDNFRKYLIVAYGFAIILITVTWLNVFLNGVYQYPWGYWFKATTIHPLYILAYSSLFFFNLILLYFAYKKSQGTERERIRYLLLALLVSYGGAVDYLSDYGINVYPAGYMFVVLCLVIIAYAITKHKLMDIEVIIKRTLVFSALVMISGLVYGSILLLLQLFLQRYSWYSQLFAGLVTIVLFILGYDLLRKVLENITNKILFQKKYEYRDVLANLTKTAGLFYRIDNLAMGINRNVCQKMGLEGAAVFILDKDHNNYPVRSVRRKAQDLKGLTLDDSYILVRELKRRGEPIDKYDIEYSLKNDKLDIREKIELEDLLVELDKLKAALVIPCASAEEDHGGKLLGFLCINEKKSGDSFTEEDKLLLTTLSSQISTSIAKIIYMQNYLQSQKELMIAERLAQVGELTSETVHDINNPLTSLTLYFSMVESAIDDNKMQMPKPLENLGKAAPREIFRIGKIAKDLLKLLKGEALEFKEIDLNKLILDSIPIYQVAAQRIEVIADLQEIPLLKAYEEGVSRILLNLVINASHAIRDAQDLEEKKIIISTSKEGDNIVLRVTDTGPGIPPDKVAKIFERFYTTKQDGSGIGLSSVMRNAKMHGGDVKVETKIGMTTFIVTFPVKNNLQ